MRRIPRYLQAVAERYVMRHLRKRVGKAQAQAALASLREALPHQFEALTKEGDARTASMNRQLAWSMAFVAGAVNAGGFLAVGRYTSHMTGVVSSLADDAALGDFATALSFLAMMLCFMGGAAVSTVLVAYGKRHRMRSRYALSLLVESIFLLAFGYLGARLNGKVHFDLPEATALLCFIMGMHNAVTTNISGAVVRTTHMTGNVTDLGIELAKLFYRNSRKLEGAPVIRADRGRLKLVGLLLASFVAGGIAGALGFRHLGFKTTIPLAFFLVLLAGRPLLLELRLLIRHLRRDLEA
ncbi:MAG TPA: YoaK family protein [Holophagaceae bacterium]|nr:YoaK family protein [Holophagaceae bacterium]